MEISRSGGRKKLEPDPLLRIAILSAASKIIREDGVRALSIAEVLSRSQLSTRAFYRHFESKNQLVSAVFLEMARAETMRLRQRMSVGPDPIRAVAAWTDGRLDLAFNDEIRSDLRQMSLEATGARKASWSVHRHRSRQRGPLDTRGCVGQRRTALGDRPLRARRYPGTRTALLPTRPGGRPRNDHRRTR
jgi:AcrR family transcriptional regulator